MNARVISLVERRAAVADPILNQVEAYWDELRAGRNAPSRAEVSPQGLTNVLSNCFILERVAAGFARFRVFGRQVGDLMGPDLRGSPLSMVFFAEDREILDETLIQVFDRPATARLALESPGGMGRDPITCKMTLLPLRDDLGSMSRVLGAVSVSGTIGNVQRRLSISGKTILDVPEGHAMKSTHLPARRLQSVPASNENVECTILKLPLRAE